MTNADEYSRCALSVPIVAILSFLVPRITILISFIKRSYVIGEGYVSPALFHLIASVQRTWLPVNSVLWIGSQNQTSVHILDYNSGAGMKITP